jgi:hypothetical protein
MLCDDDLPRTRCVDPVDFHQHVDDVRRAHTTYNIALRYLTMYFETHPVYRANADGLAVYCALPWAPWATRLSEREWLQ